MTNLQNRLWVIGGRQRKRALDLEEWHAYESGIVLEVDLDRVAAKAVVEYQTPADKCPPDNPSITFKAGDLRSDGRRLLLCTQTEIIEYCTSTWKSTFYYSHPSFNDLHHVRYRPGNDSGPELLLIANTGLDQVVELEIDRNRPDASTILNQWTTCEVDTWNRFSRDTDYRLIATTKPHQSHPNFTFEFGESLFATRFHQQDALDLTGSNPSISLPQGNPHDGVVRSNQVTFTTTNGHVVKFNLETGQQIADVDLNPLQSGNDSLGWCRGIDWEDDTRAWIGFSRIRPTWLRKNLSWVKQGFRTRGQYGTRPTRVARYDLLQGELLQEIELEEYGMNAVFGIYVSQDDHG